ACPRIAKDEHLFILHVEAHFARSGAVINPSEDGEAFIAHDFVEAANRFVDGVRAWFGNYSISQITQLAHRHCWTGTEAAKVADVPAAMMRARLGAGALL